MIYDKKILLEEAESIADMFVRHSTELSALAEKEKLMEASKPAIDFLCGLERKVTEEDLRKFEKESRASRDTIDMLDSIAHVFLINDED